MGVSVNKAWKHRSAPRIEQARPLGGIAAIIARTNLADIALANDHIAQREMGMAVTCDDLAIVDVQMHLFLPEGPFIGAQMSASIKHVPGRSHRANVIGPAIIERASQAADMDIDRSGVDKAALIPASGNQGLA